MFASYLSLLGVTALSLAGFVAAQTPTATKVGWTGTLSSLDGGLGGTVTVVDANTLMITGYKLEDASAPALYWWGATDGNLKGGFRISNMHVTEKATTDKITIKLDAGKTTADFTTVGLWCEKFSANFGQAMLKAADGSGTMRMETSSPTPTVSKPNGAATSFGKLSVGGLLLATSLIAVILA